MVKTLPANAADVGLIPGLGRSAGEGNGNSLQYSCLENPMDRGAWWGPRTVHGVAKSRTCLVAEQSTTHISIKKRKKKKDPRSKFSHILGYQGLGLQHTNLEAGRERSLFKMLTVFEALYTQDVMLRRS